MDNVRVTFPQFSKPQVSLKNIWKIINTIASIWGKNMPVFLPLDMICSSNLSFLSHFSNLTLLFCRFRSLQQIMFSEAKPRETLTPTEKEPTVSSGTSHWVFCYLTSQLKKGKKSKKSFAGRRLANKFAAVSSSTTWSCASWKFFP